MMWTVCLVFALVFISEGKDVMSRERRAVNTDEQPKMVTNNGHLIFQTGANHNITFKTGGGNGRIVIDTFDLVEMAKMVKDNKNAINTLQQSPAVPADLQTSLDQMTQDVQDLKTRVAALERTEVTLPPGLLNRVQLLEDQLTVLNNDLGNNECNSNPCQNGGTCVNLYQGFQCRCSPGYQGRTCNDDVNECATISGTEDACQNGGTCINSRGSYSCQCLPNWYGPKCTIQYDDCSSGSATDLCGHGYCVDKPRTTRDTARFECICFDGWQSASNSNNPACTIDVDECSDRNYPCSSQPRVECINVAGTYYCGSCPTGYTGNGHTCADINECQNNNGGCSLAPLVQCINTVGSRNCGTCPTGYVGNGEVCTYIGVCNQNNGGCSSLAICTENSGVPGGRVCTCPPGYTGTGEGTYGCSQSGGGGGGAGGGGGSGGTTCNDNPCVNGRCVATGLSGYNCECDDGWEGTNCDQNINECSSNPCQNSGTCTDGDSGYTCECVSGFGGSNCETTLYECGAWLSGSSGEFEFPRSGNTYPHGVSCAWVITIPQSDRVIRIEFPRFDIEEEANCNYDFLQINDGNTAAAHPIGRYCNSGDMLPPDSLTSTHDQLYFWFKSDHSVSSGGFKITWTSVEPVCGGELVGSNHGSINSPGYPGSYPNDRDCVWTVTVDAGRYMTFAFGTLRLEHHDTCDYDYLEIHDGLEEDAPSLGKFCSTVIPQPVQTTGPYATVRFHSDGSETDTGFHITYISQSTDPGCGGVFTDSTAVIISPNFPNAYPHNAECIWTIQVHEGDIVTFEITDLTIEEHLNCVYDYVELRDGFDETSPFVGRYCHSDSIPPPFRSSGNTLWVKFRSDGSVNAGGFRATYETYCGGLYTESPGEVTSPYFPDYYPHNRECEYVITAETGMAVQLTFLTFDIEGHADCAYDFVEVRDGASADSDLIDTLCGSALPQPITGTATSMYLKFSTDGSVATHGFRASYEFVEANPNGCGGLFTAPTGIFSSPAHPDTYPHGVHCVYTIQVEPGKVIRLTFNAFSIESHSSCAYDSVSIYDNTTSSGDGSLGSYCGSTPPPITTSSGNIMTVVFHTDYSVAREGFTASYVALDATTVCGGEIRSNLGVISSPNFPSNYPNNRECVWTIIADAGIVIQLNFTVFLLESGGSNCYYDYVEIRNGGYSNSPLIGRYCGSSISPSAFVSHSNRMYIKFRTDSSVTYSGFLATFDATVTGCGGTLSNPSGSFSSPNYPYAYHHYAECFWLIDISEGSLITLSFADMDLEGHSSCYYDYVKVFDGASETDPVLGTYCGTELPHPVTSTGSIIRVKMRTDYSVSGRGFHAAYVSSCDNIRLRARSGFIESPNYPAPYAHNRDCLWVVETTNGNQINITFTNLELEDNGVCRYDYVKIYDGETTTSPILDTLCGSPNVDGLAYSSSDKYIAINFHSDSSVARAGFRASYVAYGCGADMTGNTGQFMSPGYPNLYGHSRECHWTITVPNGHSIALTIHDFDVEDAYECRFDKLEVYSGHDQSGLLLTQICHTQTSAQHVSSTGNEMFVLFDTDSSVNGRGFNATYRAVEGGCGGNFSTPTGNIHSQNYPNNYDHNTDCNWLITVQEDKRVNLTFSDFQLEGASGCVFDYVKVYDGPTEDYPLLLMHCGQGLPSPPIYLSSRHQVYIRMRADGSVSRSGFYATYETVCGGRLDAAQGGVITSEDYPDRYPRGQNCTWIIESANPVDRVTLTFTYMDIEFNSNCSNDFVTVLNGNDADAPLVGRYCGDSVPAAMTSFGAAFTVLFQTDTAYSTPYYGFRATYSTSVSACGGNYTSMSGAFASPGYPDSYPTATECVWTIPSSPGNRIQVTFTVFALQDTPGCTADYLEVRQGDETGALVGKYCGSNLPSNATTYGTMWLRFYSDANTVGSGFSAQYGNVFGGTLTPPGGLIASPLYPRPYPPNVNVIWNILVAGGNRIRVTFLEFSMVITLTGECQSDDITLYDGPDVESPQLLSACGIEMPDPVESTGNVMTVKFRTDYSVSDRGFLLQWAEIQEIPPDAGCGQTLPASDTRANFTSPGYPSGYPNSLDCSWVIESDVGTTIMFNITNMGIEYQSACAYDSLKVYDGLTTDMRRIGQFCGRVPPGPLHSTSNTLLVVFHTDASVNETGFAATYKTYCGGAYTAQHAILSSPLYPSNYEPNQDCIWTVRVQEGFTIQVDFRRLAIQSSSGCNSDYLELKSGLEPTSPSLGNGRYCGNSLPGALETPSNTLRLRFVSDGSGSSAGFQLSYLAVQQGCGGQLVLSESDVGSSGYELTSPNHPQDYPLNVECNWVITAPATQAIQIDFQDPFYIGLPRHLCPSTYLEFRDGGTQNSPSIARYCGNTRPNTIKSSGNAMLVKFRTDVSEGARAGFKIIYKIATCGGTYGGTEGEITTPNFPNNYGTDLDCDWYLQGPTGHYMTLTFTDFDVSGSGDDCSQGDFVAIYDGRNQSSTRLSQLCGTSPAPLPSPVDTSDSFAYIRFRSDGTNVANGFRLQYTTSVEVCGGDLATPTGSFSSPNYPGLYAHRRVCEWRITVAEDYLVTLRFQDFDLEASERCIYDGVDVYNGLESDSPWLGTYCGTNVPLEVQSSSNTMRVVFTSDGSVSGGGFLANYDSQDSALCGGTKTVSPDSASTYVWSPGYGVSNYSNNLQCEWVIGNTSPTNSSIYMYFDRSFSVQGPAENCINDYVEIRSGTDMSGQLIGRYCGDTRPQDISAPYPNVFIQFRTDSSNVLPGFKLYYAASSCGGLVSGTNGVITSPNYPDNYDHAYHCAWLIIAPEGNTVTLTFTDFAIEQHTRCGYDRLYALNGDTLTSPQISGENPWCGQAAPDPVTSASNKILIVFKTDGSVSDRGFRLEWSTSQRGCGGNFHGNTGILSSTNYPNQYEANNECVWIITVETGYHVVLNFDSTFNINAGDSVKVYNGSTESAPLLGTYTGNTAPADVTSSLNTMRVKFQSDGSNHGNGFQARWSTGCGATFYNISTGRIVSPGYPNRPYPDSFTCEYIINWDNAEGKMLALRFDYRFDIQDSSNCANDGLDIYSGIDNTGTLLGRHCGNVSPRVVESTNSVYLYFHSDSSVSGRGFGLTFEEGCGGVYTSPSGIVQTPSHLEEYRRNENCTWSITVSSDRAVELKFTMLDVEYGGPGCIYDYVEVLDGDNFGAPSLTGRLCGTNVPQTVVSTGPTMFVNFVTDPGVEGRGFQAAYQEVFGPNQGCGGNLQQSSGSITSLDYDNDGTYDSNLNCRWYLSVEANKAVQLNFDSSFNIESSQADGCLYDYVEIRDGYGQYAPLLGKFCGTTAPASPITLTGNQAFVLFHSDEASGASGFTINYSAVDLLCGGTFNASDTPQTITSLNYPSTYPASTRCSWVISAPDDYTHVRIRITALDIQDQSNCNSDYLELRDYPLTDGGQTLRYCGNNIPTVFDSSTHAVQLYFRSDSSIQGTGFSLQYYITDCNNNYTADNGRIRSPGQAEHYHNGHECITYIATANNTYISLYFNYFAVEYQAYCQYDYLSVYNGSDDTAPLISNLCGSGLPNPIFASGNQMYLRFYTDASVTDNGYDITYTSSLVQGCGGNVTGREGSFTSPMYPDQYANNLNCEWSIEVPPGGQPVSLEFSYINIEGQQGVCNNDRVEVYNGRDSSASLFGSYCGTTPPAVLTATDAGRVMFVRFISDGTTPVGNSTYTGFRAKFTS